MRKILISLGSNKGGEFPTFKASKIYSSDFLIYAFEPEPRCFNKIANVAKNVPNITHIKKAVSTVDGTLSWNVGNLTVSGTLRDDKKWGMSGEKVLVETINLSSWFAKNINPDDYVIMTVDIEGGEYDVLEQMISTGEIDKVNKIYVEFHNNYKFDNIEEKRDEEIRATLDTRFKENFFARYVEGNVKEFGKTYPDLDPNMFNNIGTISV
tara:strand:- start:8139 stop:8768 length:630 start_codon:yes stop_codon:yes gene_type:complete